MKEVIDFLMTINWEYLPKEKVIAKLQESFNIKNHDGEEASEELLDTVIWWEKHIEIYDSLEKILKEKFILL